MPAFHLYTTVIDAGDRGILESNNVHQQHGIVSRAWHAGQAACRAGGLSHACSCMRGLQAQVRDSDRAGCEIDAHRHKASWPRSCPTSPARCAGCHCGCQTPPSQPKTSQKLAVSGGIMLLNCIQNFARISNHILIIAKLLTKDSAHPRGLPNRLQKERFAKIRAAKQEVKAALSISNALSHSDLQSNPAHDRCQAIIDSVLNFGASTFTQRCGEQYTRRVNHRLLLSKMPYGLDNACQVGSEVSVVIHMP